MSIHKSLIPKGRFEGRRNVLKRAERVLNLTKEGKFNEASSVFNLPKQRIIQMKRKKAEAAKETQEAAATTTETQATTPTEAPKEQQKQPKEKK